MLEIMSNRETAESILDYITSLMWLFDTSIVLYLDEIASGQNGALLCDFRNKIPISLEA